ncbi:hypothetical protein DFJ74DRAFT_693359 [Hyaloraphidium curvatum]|nr:hypothetical protein DFJ74DRAFT_693359 [Hyaloraphidium curvatum]
MSLSWFLLRRLCAVCCCFWRKRARTIPEYERYVDSLVRACAADTQNGKALMVLKSVLRIVVSSKEVREALKPVRFALEGLSTVEAETESSQYVSPADYSRFVAATRVRYPSVVLPELKELFSLDLPWHFLPGVNEDDRLEAPPDEQESLQNELLSPTMAVAEAARAFASRTGLRVDDVQVARERLGQLRAGYGLMDSAGRR